MRPFQKNLNDLNNLEPIKYYNGKSADFIHLGQLLNQYIYNELGTKAYQEFQNLLNETLTFIGCKSLLELNKDGYFNEIYDYYELLRDYYKETVIINYFDLIVQEIQEQLKMEIEQKYLKLKIYIENIIKEILDEEELSSLNVNFEKAVVLIQSRVDEIINFNNMTAHELNEFDMYKKTDKNKMKTQIIDVMINNISYLA